VESANEHATATKHATRNSKIDGGCVPKPTQIGYYSGAWVDVLEAAKNEYRFYIHCIADEPFPERDSDTLQDAHTCLLEAMAHYKDNPAADPLNQGKFHLNFMTITCVRLV
jgi:hypothetical protein